VRVLVDSNILLRLVQRTHPDHSSARDAIDKLVLRRGNLFHVVPQVLYEYWVVATKPPSGPKPGLGLPVEKAERELDELHRFFTFLSDSHYTFRNWKQLVLKHGVTGVRAHDARLVAAMLDHGLTHLLTFNPGDFTRYGYPGITVLHPTDVLKE
jgi:predicted nucleic acid-binding protein